MSAVWQLNERHTVYNSETRLGPFVGRKQHKNVGHLTSARLRRLYRETPSAAGGGIAAHEFGSSTSWSDHRGDG